MRLLTCAVVSLFLGSMLIFADDTKVERAVKLDALIKKFDKEMDELKSRFNTATTPAEREGLRTEAKELAVITAQKALAMAEADPKDETGFNAALFVVEKAGRFGSGKEVDSAVAIISDHHMADPKVKGLLSVLAGAGPSGQKFLQSAAEKATDKEVKGLANYYLGLKVADEIEQEEDGKRIDELIARATEFLDKATKEASGAKVGESTIGKEVATQLEAFKAIKSIAVGKALPEIEGTDLDGKKIKLSSYKGKVVLVDIWATWCGPCRAMIPHERDLVKNLKDKPFVLLSVSCDDQQETLTKFLEKEAMPWAHWFDGRRGSVAKTFRVNAFPTLYLIDHTGVIRHKWVGSPGTEKLDTAVEELVTEAIKAKG